jgi:hypothetical protein
MSTEIELSIPQYEVTARASVLTEQAPQIARLMLKSMPLEVTLYHCIRCGREVFALLDKMEEIPPKENLTIWPRPGDIWFIWFPQDYAFNPPGFTAPPQGTLDLVIWYGADSCSLDTRYLPVPGIHWATITQNLEKFAAACEDLWIDGVASLTVRSVK